ncbi:MAG: hypothetical protein KatS3mg085_567 [Candidatus Dojkabacteria bacterium]|nr:MAG: hypothetical protein KatS3mg085_567 [Candidatus Dojkabacteria bacterium]
MQNFLYNNKIVNHLIALESHKVNLSLLEISNDFKSKILNEVKLKNIFFIASILGIPQFTIKDAQKFLNSKGFVAESLDYQVLHNSINAFEFNKSALADTFNQTDESALLHINRLLILNWRDNWDARFRNFHEKVDETFDRWISLRDTQINDDERIRRYKELLQWFSDVKNDFPFWIKFSRFVFESIRLAPFIAGNQLTTIIASDFILYKNGYSTKLYMSTAEMFALNQQRIIETYQAAVINGESYWHENFLQIVLDYFLILRKNLNKFLASQEKAKSQPFLELNKRQIKILKYLQSVPTIKREDYCHMMEVSTMTAFRDLNDLVDKKLLKVEGKGRATKYKLATM